MILLLAISLIFNSDYAAADSINKSIEFTEFISGLNRVSDIYATPLGNLYIVETGRNRLLKYDKSGRRIETLGSRGIGDYGFDRPRSVDATNGMRIYVADTNNNRVQLFDRRHQFIGSLRAPERQGISAVHFSPLFVTVNKFGETFVYDSDSENIIRYNEQGRFVQAIDLKLFDIDTRPSSVTNFEDTLFIAESGRNVIHMISSGGGYLGFIPVILPVKGIFRSERHIWAVTSEYIYKLDFRGSISDAFAHSVSENITGITAIGGRLFVATNTRVLSTQKP